MTTLTKLRAVERALGPGGSCGPGCPPTAYRDYTRSGPGEKPAPCNWMGGLPGPADLEPPAPCPRCGAPALVLVTIFDADFFGNAGRLPGGNGHE
jgi:hypothetical protein